MKRILIAIFAAILLITGCSRQNISPDIEADKITIFYGVSSYAIFSSDQEVINELLGRFNSLEFEKTSDEIDLFSAFHVNFSYRDEKNKSFWVDKNGIFWLNGETQSYKVSKGSFDYDYLKKIYEGSQRKEID